MVLVPGRRVPDAALTRHRAPDRPRQRGQPPDRPRLPHRPRQLRPRDARRGRRARTRSGGDSGTVQAPRPGNAPRPGRHGQAGDRTFHRSRRRALLPPGRELQDGAGQRSRTRSSTPTAAYTGSKACTWQTRHSCRTSPPATRTCRRQSSARKSPSHCCSALPLNRRQLPGLFITRRTSGSTRHLRQPPRSHQLRIRPICALIAASGPGLLIWSEIWCDVENSESFRSSRDCRVSQVTDSRVHQLYIISLHLFSLLRA